jgi:hypothetical protein
MLSIFEIRNHRKHKSLAPLIHIFLKTKGILLCIFTTDLCQCPKLKIDLFSGSEFILDERGLV